ncbi:cysteine--tRNA ligase [Acetobacter thailandicus]|uniref:cysteine--tRNA ligase n=1 Tax=Acetobacter thailandicus TaxID=1502842 RepID=UPI001BA61430|nr:cysteine--tRNA ligase [Acetobacter thailandicus]MBS0986854.1 cysteine--tRNA ligase [Acetobacter thailandicus]
MKETGTDPGRHALFLTNTLSGRKQRFQPRDPNRVTLYVCGPTVYNYAHLGNARSAVVFDLLYRVLRQKYSRVLYARNFTDVDDKINAEAARTGQSIRVLTDRFIDAYRSDMKALGLLTPDFEPRVTDHIPDIISIISRLIDRGHAYVAEGHVLFHVPSFGQYGVLSGRKQEDLMGSGRVEIAPFKHNPADFVLWKPSSPDLPGWESLWGRGRPGWHIECSAMTENRLGLPIDLHGGGQDLIFPHHENEIAQSVSARDGAEYCKFWVHNGFVTVEGRKMSKSLGNVVLVHDLLKEAEGEAIRLALLSAHYRQPLDWSRELLERCSRTLQRLRRLLSDTDHLDQEAGVDGSAELGVARALDDDLNTPAALKALFGAARSLRHAVSHSERIRLRIELLAGLRLLGLFQENKLTSFQSVPSAFISDMLERRAEARDKRDFAEADRIRELLQTYGVTLEDTLQGTQWHIKTHNVKF